MKKFTVIALLVAFFVAGCSSSEAVTADRGPGDAPDSTTQRDEQPAAEAEEPSDEEATKPEPEAMEEEPEEVLSREPEDAPVNWHHLDQQDSPFIGMSTEKAYQELLAGREPKRTVVVAVIDGGVDVSHEDLDDVIWTNEDEVPGNNTDDDNNGYVDDIHGWNFIGGPDGQSVDRDTYELTRLYAQMRDRFAGVDPSTLSGEEKEDYERYQVIKKEFEQKVQDLENQYRNVKPAAEAVKQAETIMKNHLGTEDITEEEVQAVEAPTQRIQQAKAILNYFYQQGLTPEDVQEYNKSIEDRMEYGYNPDFNPRDIVGDDYANKTEQGYGNNDVGGPDAFHGTGVAGVIAAERNNDIGMDGVANGVRIMALRAVPNGDERDKDVANAIRYAADNGAHIINMSFGKGYSPSKVVVDEAVQYAVDKGVLLVHAAGNSGANIDTTSNFPNKFYANDTGVAELWLEVGATSYKEDGELVATFSNYGAERVDVFAPGEQIYTTIPKQKYDRIDGTSFAAPMVSGVAALLMAYFPDLTAAQVRDIILESSVKPEGQVVRPGGKQSVPFSELSTTGGVVNVYKAVQMAEQMAQ